MNYSENTGLPNTSIKHETYDDLITTGATIANIIQAKLVINDTNGLKELADALGIIMEIKQKVYEDIFQNDTI